MHLTPELKEYYQKDFTDNVLPCKDEVWALHPSLIDLCQEINKNEHIQTIFSRKAPKGEQTSYLYFSADKVGVKLLENLFDKLTDVSDFVFYNVREPEQYQSKYVGSLEMSCLKDKNYFNVDVHCFTLISTDTHEQKKFWRTIKKCLV
jgi:hypothetical protein